MKDNTKLTEEETNEIAARVGIEMAEANKGNYDASYVIPYVESLLAKKMAEREKEIADQLNEIDSVEYSFRNRKDDEYPSVRIHSGKYRHYFLSKSGLGDAVKEMFNWIKSNI